MRSTRLLICALLIPTYVGLRVLLLSIDARPMPGHVVTLAYTSVLMLVQLGLVALIAGLKLRLRTTLAVVVPTMLLLIGVMELENSLGSVSAKPTTVLMTLAVFHDLFLMVFAGVLGHMISFIVREPNILLPAALFAALVDYWNVTWGILSKAIVSRPEVVARLSVTVPTPVGCASTIGMGDFVFWALFFGVLYRFNMNTKAAFWLGYALLTASMILIMIVGGAIPALVPMGLAIIASNIRLFKLNREELLATVYVGLILFIFLAISAILFVRS
ncbi:MAG: hypothetical protein ACPL7O_01590 [Armatimonadota bacterium]